MAMTLATILIVLLIDRLLWRADALRQHHWYDRYTDWLLKLATGQWLAGQTLGGLWFLLPPLLLVVLLQWLGGTAFQLVLGAVVLLFTLGPRDLGRDCEAYQEARANDDEEGCRELAEILSGDEPAMDEPQRSLAVAEGLIRQSCQRLFGPLFWFILLGALGAALYRLAAMTAERSVTHSQAPVRMASSAQRLVGLLDWLPARLVAAAFAVAGNFDAVSRAWREREAPAEAQDDSAALLTTTGHAALDSWPDEEEIAAGEQPPVVEDAMALLWRTLIIWLLALIVLTLLAALL
jgi:membrane protein required for beta-lactamase induction